jgi:hypothetical protein
VHLKDRLGDVETNSRSGPRWESSGRLRYSLKSVDVSVSTPLGVLSCGRVCTQGLFFVAEPFCAMLTSSFFRALVGPGDGPSSPKPRPLYRDAKQSIALHD